MYKIKNLLTYILKKKPIVNSIEYNINNINSTSIVEYKNKDLEILDLTKDDLNKFITNLNNILAMIINSIESLNIHINKNDNNFDIFIKDSLKNQLIACELMKILINKLTLEYNNLEPKLESANLIIIIEKLIEIMSTLFNSTNVEYLIDIDNEFDKTKTYITDISWISLILLTLLTNAKKYTDEGSIKIKLNLLENILKISVIDTGCGIAKKKKKFLFTKKDNSNNNLYLIYQMCKKLNGSCGYQSNIYNNNKGSIFWIEIPLIKTLNISEVFIPNEIRNKLKIIICDDSKVMIEIFSNYIVKKIPNAIIYPVTNIEELLNTIKIIGKNSILILILDIFLQNDNSLDYLKNIKILNPNIGIIVHTGSSMNDTEIIKYNTTINLSMVIMHKPASLEIIEKNTKLILEILGYLNILIIDQNKTSIFLKNYFEKQNFNVFISDNITNARHILFDKLNGAPLIIFFDKNIVESFSEEIIEEFNLIEHSYKCILNNEIDNKINISYTSLNYDSNLFEINTKLLNNIIINAINKIISQ